MMHALEYDPMTVVVADARPRVRHLVREAVRQAPLRTQIRMLADAGAVTRWLAGWDPEMDTLLFMQHGLPGQDSLACIRLLRTRHGFRNPMIVMYGITGETAFVDRVLASGANAYLRKPAGAAAFRKKIADILHRAWQYHVSGLDRTAFIWQA